MKGKAKESREWEQVRAMNRWTPVNKGDEIVGYYIKRRDNVGARNYTFHTLELETGETRDILGTTILDPLMEQVPLGWEVRIVYQGAKKPIPPHQGLKLFDVFRRPANVDRESGAAGEDEDEANSPTILEGEDREAVNTIEHYRKLLKDQNKEDTPEAIIQIAESDPDLEPVDLSRLKAQLAREVKAEGGS
ncbi:hypothetical protein FGU46_03140 [Methanobacterium sp. CWC-01]|uniref:hypothetical protein n=1 Tax=Methanobacterium aridiramus TaxID=2584467 RepID=UPI0025761971|nr:hypothetical protein [Methanobacterium sp. CWC-01]WJI09154.1 hypothetical protein FGU46_03140 [Methanobacterium sp. CWC-01]